MSPRFRIISVSLATVAALALGMASGVTSASANTPTADGSAGATPPAPTPTQPPFDRGILVEVPRSAPPVLTVTRTFPRGTVFSVALFENGTTGYLWNSSLSAGSDRVVTYLDTDFVRDPAPPNMVGVGGTRYFRFQAMDCGRAVITLVYQRPWEPRPIAQVTLEIQVS